MHHRYALFEGVLHDLYLRTSGHAGVANDPGLMVLSLKQIFQEKMNLGDEEFEVACSYLEVYNEVSVVLPFM